MPFSDANTGARLDRHKDTIIWHQQFSMLFGSSGVRMKSGRELFDLALMIGPPLAAMGGRILLGSDTQATGPILKWNEGYGGFLILRSFPYLLLSSENWMNCRTFLWDSRSLGVETESPESS